MSTKKNRSSIGRYAYFLSAAAAALALNMLIFTSISLGREVYLSNSYASYLFFALLLPMLLFGLSAGKVADRFNRQHNIAGTMLIAFALTAAIYWAIRSWSTSIWQFYVVLALTFLVGTAVCFSIASRMALLANISQAANLKRDSMYLNILFLIAFGTGPVVAEVLNQRYGHSAPYAAIAALFLMSLLSILLVVSKWPTSTAAKPHRIDDSLSLAGYIQNNRPVKELLILSVLLFAIIGPVQVLLPALGKELAFIDQGAGGWFIAATAAGLLAGSLIAPAFHRHKNQAALLLTGTVSSMLTLSFVPLVAALPQLYGLIVISGVFGGFASSLLIALLQYQVADTYRGRVFALYNISRQIAPALIGLVAGAAADLYGPVRALVWVPLGLSMAIVAMAVFRRGRGVQFVKSAQESPDL